MDLSVIIVGTDEKPLLRKCLDSIYGETHDFQLEVLVVDNASTDGTGELLRQHFPGVTVLRTERRGGYIENNNLAINRARGRYLLSMNADVVIAPGTLAHMLAFMDAHPDAAVAACRLVFEDGSLQLTCRQFPNPWIYFGRLPHFLGWIAGLKKIGPSAAVRKYLMLDYDHQTTRTVDWMISAFFMMRRSVVEEIGPFAAYLVQPFYLEDVDWCFRAHLAGYRAYYVPEVSAVHLYRQGSVQGLNKLSFVHMANIVIFFWKHGWSMLFRKHRRSQR